MTSELSMFPRVRGAARDPFGRTGRGLAVKHDVLLEHVPTRVAGLAKLAENYLDTRRALAERTEEAKADRIVVRNAARSNTCRKRSVDIFEVHVPDSRSRVARDCQEIGAAKSDMARVETEVMCGLLEESFDVPRPLDRGPPVRMDDHLEYGRVGDLVDAADPLEKSTPRAVGKLARSRVARLPEARRENEELCAARGDPFGLPS